MEIDHEDVSEKDDDDDDDWLEDTEEIEAIDKLLKKDEELKKLTALTLYKPSVSQSDSQLADPPDLFALSSINPSSFSPTIHNTLVLNKACQELLIQLEKKLEGLLQENLKKQRDLERFIMSDKKKNDYSNIFIIKCLGMPYFKDLDGFNPPRNSDVEKKIAQNELMPEDLACYFKVWSLQDVNNLRTSVINHVKEVKCKELSKKEDELKKMGKINVHDYKAIIDEIDAVRNASEEMLDFDVRRIDWMKISVQNMKGMFSDTECEAKWSLELDPRLNKSKWGVEEFEELVKVAEYYDFQNWDLIAAKLGSNRSGFQCCVQFYSKKGFHEGKWTDDETQKLVELVQKYQIRDFIPWQKIAWYFDTRSIRQVKEKFETLPVKKKGRFDKIEDSMIVIGAKEFSNDFNKINQCLPNRSAKQIRSRFEYLIGKYMEPFTKEEEDKLISLVKQYSKNWKVISEHFANRSSIQCRKYWAVLEKSIREEELDDEDDWDWSELLPDNSGCKMTDEDLKMIDYKKRIRIVPEGDLADKSASFVLLLNYLHTCHDFFLGPRGRCMKDAGVAAKIIYKFQIGMETLKVHHEALMGIDEESYENLSSHSILNAEDVNILYHMQLNEGFHEDREKFVNRVLIPPNYTTLVGLRSLMLGRATIQNFATDSVPDKNEFLPNRMSFEEAKDKWKSRLKILFTLPILCSKIEVKPPEIFRPGKVIKPKPLSKRKKRAHALHLAQAKKLKRSLLTENDLILVSEKETTTRKKKPEETVQPQPKKRGRPKKIPKIINKGKKNGEGENQPDNLDSFVT